MAMYKAGLGPDYIIEKPAGRQPFVPLLKLHGSLNWATEKESRTIRPLHLASYFQHYSYNGFGNERSSARLPIGSQLVEYFKKFASVQVEAEPVIVPPSWKIRLTTTQHFQMYGLLPQSTFRKPSKFSSSAIHCQKPIHSFAICMRWEALAPRLCEESLSSIPMSRGPRIRGSRGCWAPARVPGTNIMPCRFKAPLAT